MYLKPLVIHSFYKFVCLFTLAGFSAAFEEQVPTQAWELVWSDEFDGPANTAPDSTKWGYQVGGGGWGNRELEVYTNSLENVVLDGNGNLVIRAIKEPNGVYTSGRLRTKGKFEPQYGRIEARSRSLLVKEFGRRSGCWAATTTLWVGQLAARLTLWKISAESLQLSTEACTGRATLEPLRSRARGH